VKHGITQIHQREKERKPEHPYAQHQSQAKRLIAEAEDRVHGVFEELGQRLLGFARGPPRALVIHNRRGEADPGPQAAHEPIGLGQAVQMVHDPAAHCAEVPGVERDVDVGEPVEQPVEDEVGQPLRDPAPAAAAAAAAQAETDAQKVAAEAARQQAIADKEAARERAAADKEAARQQREAERLEVQRQRELDREEARQAREAAKPTMADKMIQSAGRSIASSVGRQLGNSLLRGIFGGLLRGR